MIRVGLDLCVALLWCWAIVCAAFVLIALIGWGQDLFRRARRLATGARDGAAVRNPAHALPLRSVQPPVVTAAAHRSFKLVKGDIA